MRIYSKKQYFKARLPDNIPGYPGYHITNDGKLYSRKVYGSNQGSMYNHKWYEKRQRLNNGRYEIALKDEEGNRKVFKVSRLVAIAWVKKKKSSYDVVCHKDNNPQNNHYSNLYWGTQKMNMQQMVKDKRMVIRRGKDNYFYGKHEEHPACKTSLDTQGEIITLYKTGEFSQKQLGKRFNLSQGAICRIIKRNLLNI